MKEGQLDPRTAKEAEKYLGNVAVEISIGKAGQYLEEIDRTGAVKDLPNSDRVKLLKQTWDKLALELGNQLMNQACGLAKHRLALLRKD